MNKKLVFLWVLSFSSYAFYAQSGVEEAIQKSDVVQLSTLSGSNLGLTTHKKDEYTRLNQRILNDVNNGLRTSRFDRFDLMRLGLGASGLATSAIFAYLFYTYGIDSIREAGAENSDIVQLFCAGVLPILATPCAAVVGFRELYKSIKQFDRKQLRNRAQAVAAILANIKTRDSVQRTMPEIAALPEPESDEFVLFDAE